MEIEKKEIIDINELNQEFNILHSKEEIGCIHEEFTPSDYKRD